NPATGNALGFNRTAFLNNTIPAAQLNPTAVALLPFIPFANQPGVYNNYVANVPYANDWQKFDGRVDAHLTDRTHGFLRYGYTNALGTQNSWFASALGNGGLSRVVG